MDGELKRLCFNKDCGINPTHTSGYHRAFITYVDGGGTPDNFKMYEGHTFYNMLSESGYSGHNSGCSRGGGHRRGGVCGGGCGRG